MPSNTAPRVPSAQRQRFERHFDQGNDRAAEQDAEALTRRYPQDPFGWYALAQVHYRQKQFDAGLRACQLACEFSDKRPKAEHQLLLGKLHFALDQLPEAEQALTQAAELAPDMAETQLMLGHTYHAQQREDQAIEALDQALALDPTAMNVLAMRITVFSLARRYTTVIRDCETLMALKPQGAAYYNLVGTKYLDIGEFETARSYYNEALRRDPQHVGAASNILTGMHYDPAVSAQQIYDATLKWQSQYTQPQQPPQPEDTNPGRRLRVGMLSGGFRMHPVGYMILLGVLNLKRGNLELVYYSQDRKHDPITTQLMRSARHWKSVYKHSDDELEALLREDQLDILIDLNGHNDGNRMPVLARKPAPLLVKWVGGQINTTGLEAIDYFLSDAIETPPGVDDGYVEKIIRLPDDYICYQIPWYIDEPGDLPALSNGYITLGCLNNPTKLNAELLAHWGRMMQALPGSHLLLKGPQFEDEDFCQGIRGRLAEQGIAPERIELEGSDKHKAFLRAYQRIDIALDPWPYSGGLTTCEALVMGVPVVTHPGPTFAGRHAATHLVNAGHPEWVCDTWDEYHERVLELAGDLDNLAGIRRQLRQRVAASPLCNGQRFAENLDGALRAVWQRYCEGKAPAALTFTGQGECRFEDDTEPVVLQHPVSYLTARSRAERRFNWQLPGKLVVIDNSAKLLREADIDALRKLDAFGIVAFDPSSLVEKPGRFADSADVQLLPHAVLGDGQPATLHACLDPELSSTLKPLPGEQLLPAQRQGAQVLAKLPISTVALNSIAGLESLDWLILDHLSDASTILEHGDQALKDSLLIQVRTAFQPTHERQPTLAELQHWMARQGFRFYRFNDMAYESHLPARNDLAKTQSTELTSADVLFLPNHVRMASLSDAQRLKLAFLLHTVFNIRDLSYALLAELDEDKAEDYLLAQGMVKEPEPAAEPESEPTAKTEALADPERSDLDTGDKPTSSSATAKADEADEFIFD